MTMVENEPRILVTAAVPQELAGFRRVSSQGVEFLLTGIGRRAGDAVARRLSSGGVRGVVSAGFAGGARPGFQVGDLVAASEVIDASSGRRHRADLSLFKPRGKAESGPFLTVDRPVVEPRDKTELGSRYGAVAVEMETASVAEAAERAGVPWAGLRVILDPMESRLAVCSAGQAWSRLSHPARWGELLRFLGEVRTAGRSLAAGLDHLTQGEESDGS